MPANADWTKIRQYDVASFDVGKQIERFCEDIVEALRHPWLSPWERQQTEETEARRKAVEASRKAEEDRRRQDRERNQERDAAAARDASKLLIQEKLRKQDEVERQEDEFEDRSPTSTKTVALKTAHRSKPSMETKGLIFFASRLEYY